AGAEMGHVIDNRGFELRRAPAGGFRLLELESRHEVAIDAVLPLDEQSHFELIFLVAEPRPSELAESPHEPPEREHFENHALYEVHRMLKHPVDEKNAGECPEYGRRERKPAGPPAHQLPLVAKRGELRFEEREFRHVV